MKAIWKKWKLSLTIPFLMQRHLEEGKEIYQEVEEDLTIFPVGIVSLNKDEGYLMLSKKLRRRPVYMATRLPFSKMRMRNSEVSKQNLSGTMHTVSAILLKK